MISLFIVAFSCAINNDFTFFSKSRDINLDKCLLSCGIIALVIIGRDKMEFLVERTIVGLLAIICPLLTMFDLPGNSILLLTGFGMAFFDENMYFPNTLM